MRRACNPFGKLPAQSASANSDVQYAGEQKDPGTGLINLRARYYDPVLGRFLQRDLQGGTVGFPEPQSLE